MRDMTDPSPQQQPGYPSAEQHAYAQQQQAAYAAQQQAAAHQQSGYQPAPAASPLATKLPMNMMSLGLAGGGLAGLLLSQIIAGENLSGNLLSLPTAVVLLAGAALTTGEKFRNFFRAGTAGLTVLVAGGTIGSLISSGTQEAKTIIGLLLLLAGIGLLTAATFTMSESSQQAATPAAPPTGTIPQVQHPQATQQYPGQQPQQGGWQ